MIQNVYLTNGTGLFDEVAYEAICADLRKHSPYFRRYGGSKSFVLYLPKTGHSTSSGRKRAVTGGKGAHLLDHI